MSSKNIKCLPLANFIIATANGRRSMISERHPMFSGKSPMFSDYIRCFEKFTDHNMHDMRLKVYSTNSVTIVYKIRNMITNETFITPIAFVR